MQVVSAFRGDIKNGLADHFAEVEGEDHVGGQRSNTLDPDGIIHIVWRKDSNPALRAQGRH